MISGIDLTATVDYTLKDDKKDPTIWKLGMLPSSVMAKLANDSQKGDHIMQMIVVVKMGLVGWENFKIAGKDVVYAKDEKGITQEVVDSIPLSAIIEIGTEILKINQLTGDEQKN